MNEDLTNIIIINNNNNNEFFKQDGPSVHAYCYQRGPVKFKDILVFANPKPKLSGAKKQTNKQKNKQKKTLE